MSRGKATRPGYAGMVKGQLRLKTLWSTFIIALGTLILTLSTFVFALGLTAVVLVFKVSVGIDNVRLCRA